MKRILYIGQLQNFSTCAARMHSLQELGCITVPFDATPYTGYPQRLVRSIAHRATIGPPVRNLNRDVTRFVKSNAANVSHVWIDKGKWLYPETVQTIKEITGAVIIHYTPDAQFIQNQTRYFKAGIPLYDLLFTTKPFEVELYKQYGAKRVHLIDQGYDNIHLSLRELSFEEKRKFGSDVCFVGHCEPHYAKTLRVAFKMPGRHRVWGHGWRSYARFHSWLKDAFSGDAVWGDDYSRALNAASIALCLLTKRCPETTTTRSFEITACGAFMLAERTEDHLALYEEGKEAEFYGSLDELVDKLRYYLTHPVEREQIAVAGYERCQRSGYSNHQRARQMLQKVDELQTASRSEGN